MSDVKIVHGDCTQITPKVKGPVHAIITDPPYGMAMKSNFAVTETGKKFGNVDIANDGDVEGAIGTFIAAVAPLVEVAADEAEMYVFTSHRAIGPWIDAVEALTPFVYTNLLVWDKENPGMGNLDGNWGHNHELIIYAKKGNRKLNRRLSSVIRMPKTPPGQIIHPTQKPVELMEILIAQSTDPGDLIVDPFSGSGATIVAAQRLGRRALGIELDPQHYERSNERISQFTFDI